MQNEHKLWSWKGLRAKKSRRYMQTNTYLTTSAFTNPFLSFLERRRRPENIIVILNLFFVRETSRFNFIYVTRDRELVQHHDVYAPINVKPAGAGGGGRAWGGDLTFFKNLQLNSLPTGTSFQSNATKFPHFGLHIALSNIPRLDPRKAQ